MPEETREHNHHSLLHVYTGNGKGKTTAAWGQALRAIGRGWKVAIVRFMKTTDSGEVIAAERLSPDLVVVGETSLYDPCVDQRGSAKLRNESKRNFEKAEELVLSGDFDLVVLDEINIVLHYDFISEYQMLHLLHRRPKHTEIIMTGRYAPDWLIEAADLVTQMVEIKHPSDAKMKARKGIEY
jgi:cob(I)alamin adenosyltransferase